MSAFVLYQTPLALYRAPRHITPCTDHPTSFRSTEASASDKIRILCTRAFMQHEESINFSRAEVRKTVIPAYMGLIKQIDDHLVGSGNSSKSGTSWTRP